MTEPPTGAPTWYEAGSVRRPRSAAFWLLALLIGVGALNLGNTVAITVRVFTTPALVGITVLLLIAAPVVALVYALDLFEREPFGLAATALLWGACAATLLAIQANEATASLLAKTVGQSFAEDWSAAMSAPFTEEIAKAAGILLLLIVARSEFDSPIDGLVYGALVGLGFQIAEDYIYFIFAVAESGGALSAGLVILAFRLIVFGVWSHAAYTGLAGLGIAYAATRPDRPRSTRLAVALGLFALAVTMHFLRNAPWLPRFLPESLLGLISHSILAGLPGFALLVVLFLHARRRESRWVESVLAPEVPRGVLTDDEIAALCSYLGRRRRRRAARATYGSRAGRATRKLQREQVELALELTRTRGADSARVAECRATIRDLRDDLARLTESADRRLS